MIAVCFLIKCCEITSEAPLGQKLPLEILLVILGVNETTNVEALNRKEGLHA